MSIRERFSGFPARPSRRCRGAVAASISRLAEHEDLPN